MPKRATHKAKCPVCRSTVTLERDATQFIQALQERGPWFVGFMGGLEAMMNAAVVGRFRDAHSARTQLHWACDACIESGKALRARPAAQRFQDCVPFYAYYDLSFNCRTCEKPFVFSKDEQRFWYESRRFWVQSFPKECVNCRKEKRAEKLKNKRNSIKKD